MKLILNLWVIEVIIYIDAKYPYYKSFTYSPSFWKTETQKKKSMAICHFLKILIDIEIVDNLIKKLYYLYKIIHRK